jgi:hypothetical protein
VPPSADCLPHYPWPKAFLTAALVHGIEFDLKTEALHWYVAILRCTIHWLGNRPPLCYAVEANSKTSKIFYTLESRPKLREFVMDSAANRGQRAIKAEPWFSRCPPRSGHRSALLALLAAFGALAFVFSAISPTDDDIQQEFLRTSKSTQCAFASHRAVSNLRIFQIRAVFSAPAPPTPQFPSHFAIARVSVPEDEIKGRVCSGRTGDRSPPTASSKALTQFF